MFRSLNNIKSIISANPVPSNPTLQFIRWKRKPLGLPVARSRLYKIPARPVLPEDENAELKRLFNNYRTQIKSMRRYLTYTYSTKYTASVDSEQHRKEFEADFKRCHELNEKWNAARSAEREERLARELEESLKLVEERKASRAQTEQEMFEQNEEIVRSEKEASKNFVTAENLDKAIEFAINNPVDYNYAIDLNGERIIGRETTPTDALENTKKSVTQ